MSENLYAQLTERNVGLLTEAQQKTLKETTIAVLGLGGLGGVIAEILARAGVESLNIVDNDKFEPSNLNRQIYCFDDTFGKLKTEVSEAFLKKINPQLKIQAFTEVTEENIDAILKGAAVAVLAIDSAKPCLIISRAARRLGIPLVEGWAIPYGNVRVITKDTPSLEEIYGFPTVGKDIKDITDEEYLQLKLAMLACMKKIEGVETFYPPAAIERIRARRIPSFAPLVWLTAVLMSLETIKIILNWGTQALAPRFALFNPFDGTIPGQET